jgi:hypothetical protein
MMGPRFAKDGVRVGLIEKSHKSKLTESEVGSRLGLLERYRHYSRSPSLARCETRQRTSRQCALGEGPRSSWHPHLDY